ncbi:MAG: T9SS type A sorting domain-containing protein [Bacteroidia bacterium]|nr:T9SS type A sorting domain-containing protein [Bacteroidia bacterium]
MKFQRITVLTLIVSAVFIMSMLASLTNKATSNYHTKEEIASFQLHTGPIGPGEYFLPSSRCQGCHGFDSLGMANINEDLVDVNLFDRWEPSMMANAARDPFWRAKVSHEKLINPPHALALENKCVTCHAPMGHYNAVYKGIANYTIADLDNDSLGIDGVSCAGCHTIGPNTGTVFSGQIPYDTTRNIYGPFQNPMMGPMQLYTGYTPMYGEHMEKSEACASCHTLFTQSADLNGNLTGGEFIEQATFHEHKNSYYYQNNITCQNCHMARITDPIMIANGYLSLTPRTPFNQHSFAGANLFMVKLMKQHKNSLNISTPDFKYDTAITAIEMMLKERSVNLTLHFDSIVNDSAYFRVKLLNKAGHKFPSGYPSRRAILQFVVKDNNNDTVFKSGILHSDFSVAGESNTSFEPHRHIINQSGVNQIYELVMGDVNSQLTTILERAAIVLKDNRLVPLGFSTQHYAYDTAKISLDALNDPDFNKINGVEGSGTDEIHFHVPINGINSPINVSAKIIYQTLPPKFVSDMFSYSSAPIDTFRNMYNNADKTPVVASADSLLNLQLVTYNGAIENIKDEVKVFPTITNDGKISINAYGKLELKQIDIYNSEGKLVYNRNIQGSNKNETIWIKESPGIYFVKVVTNKKNFFFKTVKQ